MVTANSRGHLIKFINNEWVYADNGKPIDKEIRSCKRCGCMPTPEGYDACLGFVNDMSSACCGHGVEEPYFIKAEQMTTIK